VVHEQGVTVTRSISRITALALAITAVAVPAASASASGSGDVPKTDFGKSQTAPTSLVTPDARDAARPAASVDRVSPDARDNGRREPAPVVLTQPPVVATDGFDWADAVIGAAGLAVLTIVLGGTAVTLRTRRGAVRAS
jgi:hypothetical protein